jgi:uncharacterized membrane protein YoaK (UPF0700 family)
VPGRDAAVPERLVPWLLAALAAAAGCLDAVCVARLGGAFASVITGNLVQFGRGVSTSGGGLAAAAASAVAGYAAGVAAGSAVTGGGGSGWHRRNTWLTTAEVAAVAAVQVGWLATGGRAGGGAAWLLVALASAAMGVQSVVTIGSGVHGASTTYLTGTLTTVARTVTAGPRRGVGGRVGGDAGRMAALLGGAAVGALLLRFAPLWAPVPSLALIGAVTVAAAATGRAGAAPATSRDNP